MIAAPELIEIPGLADLIAPDPDPGTTLDDQPGRAPRNRAIRRLHSVGATLRGIGPGFRRRIRAAYRRLGGQCRPLNPGRRAILGEAIFAVENDLEHRQRLHPQVSILRTARNALYDDLGWNERLHLRHPTR